EIEIVKRVRHGHAHVGPGPLEAGEPSGAVAQRAQVALGDEPAQRVGDRMEAKDVSDLQKARALALEVGQGPALGRVEGERLLAEARLARGKAFTREPPMRVGRSDEIDRVYLGQGRSEVREDTRRGHSRADRGGASLLRDVRNPQVDAEITENAKVLFSPPP